MRQSLSPFRRLWPFFFQAMEHITEETIKSVKSELLDLTWPQHWSKCNQ